jgi:hypothetical protein
MWLPDESKAVLVRFHARGKDVETAWAEDLGSVPGRPGARRVRLGNVLALHPKPTYGDVSEALPVTTNTPCAYLTATLHCNTSVSDLRELQVSATSTRRELERMLHMPVVVGYNLNVRAPSWCGGWSRGS